MTVRSDSAECLHDLEVLALAGIELGIQHELGHADHAVHRRANLVAHVGEEFALGPIGGLGGFPRGIQVGDQAEPGDSQRHLVGHGLQGRRAPPARAAVARTTARIPSRPDPYPSGKPTTSA